jgi:hypothetical protein
MVADPVFVESLKTCKGLVVMTNDLKDWLVDHLPFSVNVFVIDHPTEIVENVFTMDAFLSNPNRMVVQIGGWLRNPYHIYSVPTPPDQTALTHKAALKGRMMENYFMPSNIDSIADVIRDEVKQDSECIINGGSLGGEQVCDGSSNGVTWRNKFVESMVHNLQGNQTSVQILERLTNSDYDTLLTQNIVMLNLYEVAACNTVIECIVRHTPIIVNRLPGLEEVLGKNYPLFYDTVYEASRLCQDISAIVAGSLHLKALNITRFSLDTFLVRFQNIIATAITGVPFKDYVIEEPVVIIAPPVPPVPPVPEKTSPVVNNDIVLAAGGEAGEEEYEIALTNRENSKILQSQQKPQRWTERLRLFKPKTVKWFKRTGSQGSYGTQS